jgi:hypothetical protein
MLSTESVTQRNTQPVFLKTQFGTWITALVQVQHHHKEAGRRQTFNWVEVCFLANYYHVQKFGSVFYIQFPVKIHCSSTQ